MKKSSLGVLIGLLLIVGIAVSTSAAIPADFVDTEVQIATPPGGVGNWPEHWVYWEQYYYAMTSGDNGIRWRTQEAAPTIEYWVNQAISMWNAVVPHGYEAFVRVPFSDTSADLTIYYANCPGLPDVGCFTVTEWYPASVLNVNLWKKATIHIRQNETGKLWSTPGLTGAIAHELGHAMGLYEQYNSDNTCNVNSESIMDTLYISNGYRYHCDGGTIEVSDNSRVTNHYLSGDYWYISSGIEFYNGGIRSKWLDRAYNDREMEVYYYYSVNGWGGPWTHFKTLRSVGDNGSRYNILDATSRVIWSAWMNPSNEGVHNKYILPCTRPVFNNFNDLGTFQCYYHSLFWPY
jgi:hypothetical protein